MMRQADQATTKHVSHDVAAVVEPVSSLQKGAPPAE